MIRKSSLLLSFIAVVSALQATPLTYNLSFQIFTGFQNPLPTGSFTYDSSLAVNPFSNFTVVAGGFPLDLTNSANVPNGFSSVGACWSSNSATGFFNGLTGSGCIATWYVFKSRQGFDLFQISVCSSQGTQCNDGSIAILFQGTISGLSTGEVTATAAVTAPEPGAVWLCGIGMAALISRAWVTRKIRNA